MTKDELKSALDERGVEYKATDDKAELERLYGGDGKDYETPINPDEGEAVREGEVTYEGDEGAAVQLSEERDVVVGTETVPMIQVKLVRDVWDQDGNRIIKGSVMDVPATEAVGLVEDGKVKRA